MVEMLTRVPIDVRCSKTYFIGGSLWAGGLTDRMNRTKIRNGFPFKTHIVNLLNAEKRRCPLAEAQDYYKLLYQSAFGISHWIDSPGHAAEHIRSEYTSVTADTSIPLMVDITLIEPVCRLNLCPLKAMAVPVNGLIDSVIDSARCFERITDQDFERAVTILDDFLEREHLLPSGKRVGTWFTGTVYKPVHHSITYRNTYHPHYVVISPDCFPDVNSLVIGSGV
jgi:hypothetical protein